MFKLKIALFVFLFAAIITLLAWLIRLPEVTVSESVISGNEITETKDIEGVIISHLEGSYLWLVPKRSTFFYPKRKIEKAINDEFPRIREVSVDKQNFITLVVNVVERKPFALWCGEKYFKDGENLGNCYFVDEASYIYAKAPDFSGNVFFKYFGNLSQQSKYKKLAPLGASYMSEEDFSGIRPFIESFNDLGFIGASLSRIDGKDYELRTESGTIIIFGDDIRLSVLLDNMESILDSDAFRENSEAQIEYIDLRFGNKVYYKFVGEDEVAPNE